MLDLPLKMLFPVEIPFSSCYNESKETPASIRLRDTRRFTMKQTPTPLPYIQAFEQLGFGMFVHFGLYSQLEKGEWTYSIHKRAPEDYKPLRESFRVGSMRDIVETAKSAGCKYITLTTRHHEPPRGLFPLRYQGTQRVRRHAFSHGTRPHPRIRRRMQKRGHHSLLLSHHARLAPPGF